MLIPEAPVTAPTARLLPLNKGVGFNVALSWDEAVIEIIFEFRGAVVGFWLFWADVYAPDFC